jgi:glycosyltransferase involved in cell wall biosynthesis
MNNMQPSISILIIAHNEERHIRECIESLLFQSKQASEIVCIAHNCTDKTADIVKEYPQVTLYEYLSDETGPIPARKYGFEKVR